MAKTRMGARVTNERAPRRYVDLPLLWIVFLGAIVRLFRLGKPAGALIFDEAYYVQAARVILGLPVEPHHLPAGALGGFDPNAEHPPLAKLLMAASMHVLGDRGLGWRLPSVVLGTVSIVLIYDIARSVGVTVAGARLAAFVLAFENLAFVHGRIATLDVYVMTFMLLGTSLYLRRSVAYAGIAFGVAALCKLNGVFGLAAMGLFELGRALHERRRLAEHVEPFVTACVTCGLFSFFALGALDAGWSDQPGPMAHLAHIVRFGASLKSTPGLPSAESTPLQWWLDQAPIEYLAVRVTTGAVTRTTVLFRGAMNEYVIFAAPAALAYAAFRARRGSRDGLLAVSMFLASYVPLLLGWWLASRRMYIYYFLPALPGVALALGSLWSPTPRVVRWTFVFAAIYAFVAWFPFRSL